NAQNFLLQGYGTTTRNNSQISSFEVLGHRFTLKNVQAFANIGVQARTISTTSGSKTINITGAGQTTAGFLKYQKITGTGIPAFSYIDTIVNSTSFTINQNATATGTNVAATIQPKAPIVIDCSGTITENGVPNTPRGKHIFDGVSFSNPSGDSAVDIFNCGSFIEFKDCDFGNKTINIFSSSASLSVTIVRCNNGVVNTYSPNIITIKSYSPSVYSGLLNVPSLFTDFDKATPVAYSLLRQYSALGLALPVPLGSMLIHDDVGGNLQMLKCKTAYTIAAAPGVGTGVDLTKYDIQTDASKQNIARRTKVFANQATNFTISQADIDNFESFEFNQTTTGIVISLSTPTGSIKKDIYFKNTGTTSINLLNTTNPIGEGKMTIASYNLTSWNILSGGGDGGGGAGEALPYFYGFRILPDSSLSFEKSLLSDLTVLDVNEFDDYFISTLNLNYSIETGDLILSQGV
ncbi:MAG: hypothetical protein EBX50_16310, partial [Chitinophagia bacterium]|nr:hypothetical protein [Chitinophagia bacterium]